MSLPTNQDRDGLYQITRFDRRNKKRRIQRNGFDPQEITNLPNEEWRRVAHYPDYLVSNLGRVRSKKKVLNLSKTNDYGHLSVEIVNEFGRRRVMVHRLVMSAFFGESKLHVNHIDFNPKNNNLQNLEYVTPKQNHWHSRMNGRFNDLKARESNPRVKLNRETAINAYRDILNGSKYSVLSKKYGVHISTLCDLKNGRCWSDLTDILKR